MLHRLRTRFRRLGRAFRIAFNSPRPEDDWLYQVCKFPHPLPHLTARPPPHLPRLFACTHFQLTDPQYRRDLQNDPEWNTLYHQRGCDCEVCRDNWDVLTLVEEENVFRGLRVFMAYGGR